MDIKALEKIDQLRKQGVISETEFATEKAKILGVNSGNSPVATTSRTIAPKILGVLSVLFGILGFSRILPPLMVQLDGNVLLAAHSLWQGYIFNAVLITAGIGLTLYKTWGRKIMIIGAPLAIVFTVLLWLFLPGLIAMLNDERFLRSFLFGCWIGLIYPTVLLLFCARKSFKDALA